MRVSVCKRLFFTKGRWLKVYALAVGGERESDHCDASAVTSSRANGIRQASWLPSVAHTALHHTLRRRAEG